MVSDHSLSRAQAGAALRAAQSSLLLLRTLFVTELVILMLVALSWIAWEKGIFMGFRGSVHFGAPDPFAEGQLGMLRLALSALMAFGALAAITHLHLFPRVFVIGFASFTTANYVLNSIMSASFEWPAIIQLAILWLLLIPASKMSRAMLAHPAVFLAHYGGGKIVRHTDTADEEEALDRAWQLVRKRAIKRTWIGGLVMLLLLVAAWLAL